MDNITDEMLAAYIDGNATQEEREIISNTKVDIPSYVQDIQLSSEIEVPTDFAMDIDVNPYMQSYADTCAIKSNS